MADRLRPVAGPLGCQRARSNDSDAPRPAPGTAVLFTVKTLIQKHFWSGQGPWVSVGLVVSGCFSPACGETRRQALARLAACRRRVETTEPAVSAYVCVCADAQCTEHSLQVIARVLENSGNLLTRPGALGPMFARPVCPAGLPGALGHFFARPVCREL